MKSDVERHDSKGDTLVNQAPQRNATSDPHATRGDASAAARGGLLRGVFFWPARQAAISPTPEQPECVGTSSTRGPGQEERAA